MFEYKIIYCLGNLNLDETLNSLTEQGWELVSIKEYATLKRKLI